MLHEPDSQVVAMEQERCFEPPEQPGTARNGFANILRTEINAVVENSVTRMLINPAIVVSYDPMERNGGIIF
jgi:hypothetical protein